MDATNGIDFGQAHLFDATSGELRHTLNHPIAIDGDEFGRSVAVNGNHALIGAPEDQTVGSLAGQAHLFDVTTGAILQTFDNPTPTGPGLFGSTVAMSGDRALIAAPDCCNLVGEGEIGQAHLFDLAGNLLHTFDDPTMTPGGQFGSGAVTVDEEFVLIAGAWRGGPVGQVHLFDANSYELLQTFDDPTPTIRGGFGGSDRFGFSIAHDGEHFLIAAPYDDTNGRDVGQVHLFDIDGNLVRTFDDPAPTAGDKFGWSVALDGNHVLISDSSGNTNGVDTGQAHLFDLDGNLLLTLNNPDPMEGDFFGAPVAFEDGRALIAATGRDVMGKDVAELTCSNFETRPGISMGTASWVGTTFWSGNVESRPNPTASPTSAFGKRTTGQLVRSPRRTWSPNRARGCAQSSRLSDSCLLPGVGQALIPVCNRDYQQSLTARLTKQHAGAPGWSSPQHGLLPQVSHAAT